MNTNEARLPVRWRAPAQMGACTPACVRQNVPLGNFLTQPGFESSFLVRKLLMRLAKVG